MPTTVISTDLIRTDQDGYWLTVPATQLVVLAGVTVAATGGAEGHGILNQAVSCSFVIQGTVIGFRGLVSETRAAVTVASTGSLIGDSIGLQLIDGSGFVHNSGQILAGAIGISAAGATTILNTGTISGPTALSLSTSDDVVTNAGTIIGTVDLSSGNDLFDNTAGTVLGTVFLGGGDDTYLGGVGTDRVVDGLGTDDIALGAGNDTLVASADQTFDFFDGGPGTDTLDLRSAMGKSTITDLSLGVLRGGALGTAEITGFERFIGSYGSNRMIGDDQANTLIGNAGNDTLLGGGGNDLIRTGEGANRAEGGKGNDRLYGGSGRDTLFGGDGNDLIYGSYDVDLMEGGAGRDRFVFRDVDELFPSTGTGMDRIFDFAPGTDIIDLSQIDWNATGPDSAFVFRGTGAITAAGQVAIRQTGGNTLIDISWQTAGVANSIRLDGILTLTAADFVL